MGSSEKDDEEGDDDADDEEGRVMALGEEH